MSAVTLETLNSGLEPNQTLQYSPSEIARFMINGGMHEKAPNKWNATDKAIEKQRVKDREVGVIHATISKESLSTGESIVISSFETLKRLEKDLSHWTPQTYLWGRRNNEGRTFENMRSVTCFGVEVDFEITKEEIFYASAALGLPEPNLILQTPNSKGYQWFYVTNFPFSFSKKGRKAAKFIGHELRRAFAHQIAADKSADPLGYFRFPNQENIRYFQDKKVNSSWLLSWAKEQKKVYKRSLAQKKNSYMMANYGIMQDPAIRKLLNDVFIRGTRGEHGRNSAAFTLALALKYDGKSEHEILDTLDEWNSSLKMPVSHNEIKKTVRSAMREKYKAPQKDYVEDLTGMEMKFKYNIRTPRIDRDKREQSHYSEWENDVIEYIETHYNEENPYISGSLRSLGQSIGTWSIVGKSMNKDSLKDVIYKSKKLVVKSNGKRGRYACTYLTTRRMIFKFNKSLFGMFLEVMASAGHEEAPKLSQALEQSFAAPLKLEDSKGFDDGPYG